MRFDGSYPEQAFIAAIDAALEKITRFKINNSKVKTAQSAIQQLFSDAKNKIVAVEADYQHRISPEFLHLLEEKRKKTLELSNQFITAVNGFKAIFEPLARHIPSGAASRPREAIIGEFLANISAAHDRGVSQGRVLALFMLFGLPLIRTARRALPLEDRHNPAAVYTCIEYTMRTITRRLREVGQPDVVAMWENQTSAFEACTTDLERLDALSKSISEIEDAASTAWEEFDAFATQNNNDLKKLHKKMLALRAVVLPLLDDIIPQQKSIKLPPNNYGLVDLLNAIECGQMELLNTFDAAQRDFRKMMNAADVLEFASESQSEASAESDDSDSDSISSSSCSHASFFSQRLPDGSPKTKKQRLETQSDLDEEELNLLGVQKDTSSSARM